MVMPLGASFAKKTCPSGSHASLSAEDKQQMKVGCCLRLHINLNHMKASETKLHFLSECAHIHTRTHVSYFLYWSWLEWQGHFPLAVRVALSFPGQPISPTPELIGNFDCPLSSKRQRDFSSCNPHINPSHLYLPSPSLLLHTAIFPSEIFLPYSSVHSAVGYWFSVH